MIHSKNKPNIDKYFNVSNVFGSFNSQNIKSERSGEQEGRFEGSRFGVQVCHIN